MSAGLKFRQAVAAEQPLQVIGTINAYHAHFARRCGYRAIYLSGGGVAGQAGAVAHGIARALQKMNAELRPSLKKAGHIRRDPREKERKKAGQPGARKRFQFSKR